MPPGGRSTQLARSKGARALFIVAGVFFLVLGMVGVFLPLLPTTPFVLVAAACFARGSTRFHRWLLSNRTFGPMIAEWEQHGSIPYRTKLTGIALMAIGLGASIVIFVRPWPLQLALAAFGVALGVWMYRLPSRDAPRGSEDKRR